VGLWCAWEGAESLSTHSTTTPEQGLNHVPQQGLRRSLTVPVLVSCVMMEQEKVILGPKPDFGKKLFLDVNLSLRGEMPLLERSVSAEMRQHWRLLEPV